MLAGLVKDRSDRNHWIGTTSGVCVRSPTSGKNFVTAAAHGFPAGVGDPVFHPRGFPLQKMDPIKNIKSAQSRKYLEIQTLL